ncbi:kinase-like domain-containing protein [Rhizophagus clarus]|uniref:Kinase-like domain-containing protein n=1 Tax=Rhizophagus clarus TaxID=94130 RepID=A0A8H3LSD1_9GLOM|nr:kinase-like domain-containing protein [Rhizophagus clarus]
MKNHENWFSSIIGFFYEYDIDNDDNDDNDIIESKSLEFYLLSINKEKNLITIYQVLNIIEKKKHEHKAFECYLKASEEGNSSAQNNLGYCYQHGICYQNGIGTNKDNKKPLNIIQNRQHNVDWVIDIKMELEQPKI